MSSERPGWTAVALGVAGGFLVGVLLVVFLGAANGGETRTVTVAAAVGSSPTTAATSGATVVKLAQVPDVTGERLDIAEDRVKRSGFLVERKGGGLLGVRIVSNWDVAQQDPPAGAMREQGSTVRLHVTRR
jgi:PASTA domain